MNPEIPQWRQKWQTDHEKRKHHKVMDHVWKINQNLKCNCLVVIMQYLHFLKVLKIGSTDNIIQNSGILGYGLNTVMIPSKTMKRIVGSRFKRSVNGTIYKIVAFIWNDERNKNLKWSNISVKKYQYKPTLGCKFFDCILWNKMFILESVVLNKICCTNLEI